MGYLIAFIILLILFVLLITIVPVVMVVYLKKKQLKLTFVPKSQTSFKKIVQKTKDLEEECEDLNNKNNELKKAISDQNLQIDLLKKNNENFLLNATSLTAEQAKKELFNLLKIKFKKELAQEYVKIKHEFNEAQEIYAQNILVETMEQIAEPLIVERSLFNIDIIDENLKGKIIGRDGRNKAVFENEGGVDLIVDRQQPIVGISTPNPIRREIARIVMQKLIDSKNIDINRIELLFKEEREKFEKKVFEIGKNVVEQTLGFFDLPEGIYSYIGRMKFRNSYGQNILSHSLEVAEYAERIAKLINIDPIKAKKAAFFHDIGKTIDFESDLDHVEAGLLIAKKFNLDDYIYNAIESHHNKVIPTTIYGALVKIVDTLSAARPGARVNSYDEYYSRVKELETICMRFEGVKSAYVIKSGRQLRVIVDSNLVSDEQLELLGHEIKVAIEENDLLTNYKIKIVLIKEKRISIDTNIIG